MKLFLDTGNVKEIETLAAIGIIDGVTTNPSLMAKEAGDYRKTMKEICRIVQGPVSAEVLATDFEGMMREGRDLATIDEHIVVKVPFTRDGVRACKTLTREGLKVNVTLVFSAAQALLAAKAGATMVSPFVGRLDDVGQTGMALIQEIVEIYRNYPFQTEVLVASTRHPIHIIEAAKMGADICTCPAKVIDQLFKHPLTDIGLANFLKDWEKSQARSRVEAGTRKTQARLSSSSARRARRRRRAAAAAARRRQADRARAHRAAVRPRHLRRDRQARHAPVPRFRDGRPGHPGRRRHRRTRPHRRPGRLCFCAGLHRLRRISVGNQRREDRQDHGPRDEDGRADRRAQRLGRGAHSGRRAVARRLRRHLSPQHTRLGRRPANLGRHGPLRRRRRVLAGDHRFHHHGARVRATCS